MAASSDYTPATLLSLPVTDKLRDFIPKFFQLSDNPARNKEWVDCFDPDATVIMGKDQASGTESECTYRGREPPWWILWGIEEALRLTRLLFQLPEIRQLRDRMWEKVASRKHTVSRFLEDAHELEEEEGERKFMLFGEVTYGLKTGETKVGSWSANARVKNTDQVRFLYYEVQISS
ncbi:hypothetical protein PG987_008542 [Apiospora arundinis]